MPDADKVVINLATGLEDPERVIVAFLVGGAAVEQGRQVTMFLTKEAARVRLRGSSFVCSLELAVERDNGTYDFIPLVLEPAAVPGGRPSTG